MLRKPEISAGLMGHLAHMQTLPYLLIHHISFMSMVTYVFYCIIRNNTWQRTIKQSFKKIVHQLLFLRNHLNRGWPFTEGHQKLAQGMVENSCTNNNACAATLNNINGNETEALRTLANLQIAFGGLKICESKQIL